ncbi:MAG: PKD domain-containing protein [Solirubrobacterales bacterium]
MAACAAAAALPTVASAGEIKIVGPRGGETKSVDLVSLAGSFDVDQDYEIRSASGSTRSERIRGISIGALLAAIDADPVYGGVEIVRPNGGFVLISKTQILTSSPTPVVYESGGELRFLRASSDAEDNNADDIVSTPGDLVIRQTDATGVQVVARASKSKVGIRELVRFTAKVTGVGAGEKFEVTWNFRDGKSAKGLEVSHRFAKRGRYAVLATVKVLGSEQSSPDTTSVQVGKPVKSDKDRSGGGTNDSAGAPQSGASDGESGTGDSANTEKPDPESKSEKSQPAVESEPVPPQITGQLLDPNARTGSAPSSLAARSGQQAEQTAPGAGVPGEAIGAAGALGLLGLGFLMELGVLARFRTRLTLGQ